MKILIIAGNLDQSAPGIVFQRIVNGLSKLHEVHVIASHLDSSISLFSNDLRIIQKQKTNSKFDKLSMILFKRNLVDNLWGKKVAKSIHPKENYDLIFGLISFGHYEGLFGGLELRKKLLSPLAIYSVDAIPAPEGWMPKDYFYYSLKSMIRKNLSKTNAMFSSNDKMLNYQMSLMINKKKIFSSTVYTPSIGTFKILPPSKESENIFLYTGGIYGPRKLDYLFQAFENLIQKYPFARLWFVGTKISKQFLERYSEELQNKVSVYPFSDDLESYYQKATALIDIDADLPDDIFISSKIVNYLMVDRLIISETGEDSPSRLLFSGIESISQCNHSAKELYLAMENAITCADINYESRKVIIDKFHVNSVCKKLSEDLKNFLSFNKKNYEN
ncbi:glycosyltransferase [Sphingobacterium sp. CZ-2]|uniref:glycosyltransferase n=1 Tax=Sphingobacterium sp. CZ-2 TaxID=2557994 RepID=UPI00106FD6D3|nr:glycosyltransferase [Sphingobacterium sp. CZ-2]QBR13606.1 glycosyltransferase [Sphingobacterium sp. CZ-2]